MLLDRDNEETFREMVKEVSMGKSETSQLREIYGAWVKGRLVEVE